MRLTDLEPRWVSVESGRHGMGVNFYCPIPGHNHCIGVYFQNPIDGGTPAPAKFLPSPRWSRTGDTFDTLTLVPSIDAKKFDPTCWHGYITNGEVTTV